MSVARTKSMMDVLKVRNAALNSIEKRNAVIGVTSLHLVAAYVSKF